jgi:hypothetical protein
MDKRRRLCRFVRFSGAVTPGFLVRNIYLYVRKRRTNVFNVVVIKLVFYLVMVMFGKELISDYKT